MKTKLLVYFVLIYFVAIGQKNQSLDSIKNIKLAPITIGYQTENSPPLRYNDTIRTIIKAKLHNLYPHATNVMLLPSLMSDHKQTIALNCPYDKTICKIILTYDSSANILSRAIFYNTTKSLPRAIVRYIKENSSPDLKFYDYYLVKKTNDKGEVTYSVMTSMFMSFGCPRNFIFTFTKSGKLVSKEDNTALQ